MPGMAPELILHSRFMLSPTECLSHKSKLQSVVETSPTREMRSVNRNTLNGPSGRLRLLSLAARLREVGSRRNTLRRRWSPGNAVKRQPADDQEEQAASRAQNREPE